MAHFSRFAGALVVTILAVRLVAGGDLSPGEWPAEERAELERLELDANVGTKAIRVVEGAEGLVAATLSPVSVRVGLDVLKQGGSAADAAAATALTQTTISAGAFISYAGIMQLVYFDAATGKVYSLDAGWATYAEETEPKTIPGAAVLDREQGRKTLVPGFMSGIEALHRRFGVLPWQELFAPAIWYAENGAPVSRVLAGAFRKNEKVFSRTEGGRRFLQQAGERLPAAGNRLVQRELAHTLRAIAHDGARHMYSGPWAQHFVEAVRREGGKAALADLENYQPIWQEPLQATFGGQTIYTPGRSGEGGYQVLTALNLIEALKIDQMRPYWQDPAAWLKLSRVLNVTDVGAAWMLERARAKGVTLALEDRTTKEFAAALAPLVEDFFRDQKTPAEAEPKTEHTAGMVVVDRHGNVAALVHSINTVNWGTTGMVVDGIPLPDRAGPGLAARPPGARIPDQMTPLIALRDGRPTLAVAITGFGIRRETVRIVLGLLANHADPKALMTAPPLVVPNGNRTAEHVLPEGAYADDFLVRLRALGRTFQMIPAPQARSLRGVGAFGQIDPDTRRRSTIEVPGVYAFAAGY